jgi:type III pantothenate kinase
MENEEIFSHFPFSVFPFSVMLLVIDIGNTNVSLGVFEGENLIARWRMASDTARTTDEYGVSLRQMFEAAAIDYKKICAVVVASVVPPLDSTFREMSEKYFNRAGIFVGGTTDFGFPIKYDTPSALGADRIVAAFAARTRYGAPCFVVDFGTATNFEAVNSKGEYTGGVIAPGVKVFAAALFSKAAKLPPVEIKKPVSVIGTTTVGSIESGIYYGYAGLVDGILRRMIDELGEKNARVIATGGLASLISQASELIETVDDTLTLEGLRLIYGRIGG